MNILHTKQGYSWAKQLVGKVCPKEALEYAYSGCTITRHGTGQSDTGEVEVGARPTFLPNRPESS